MIPRVTATVDLAAIQFNLRRVRQLAPASRVMAAVKADAYGHGAVPVARALDEAGVDCLAVACMEEAQELREAHLRAPIALLEGVLSPDEAALAAYEGMEVVVHDFWQVQLLEAMPSHSNIAVWFKLDSGMHRLGFPLDAVPRLREVLARHPSWRFRGWITHLARADEIACDATLGQIARFDEALANIPGARSIANSAGLIAWPSARRDWVRPGLALYGASPLPDRTGAELGFKPALRLESRLLSIRTYDAGEPIGYGASYVCPQRMPIGVVTVGYADCLHRALPNGAPVSVRGRRAPLAGRVSMDMITVDLRGIPDAKVGDPVLIFGEGLPVEEIAQAARTIPYEVFCGLTNRVRFRYVGGES
jgi:alanine racemase